MKITFGYSPCPNDTFMFYAISSGILRLPGYELEAQLHDVETLNRMAVRKELDITKLSFHAWLNVKDYYGFLNTGAALGYGCGPVLIARRHLKPGDIRACRVALPGEWTTAHLLFQLWEPAAKDKLFVKYDQIFESLKSGRADCGVIIHESRFTYKKEGFHEIVDLGAWWEKETALPIPLGCIAVKKTVSENFKRQLNTLIFESIRYAETHPEEILPYILRYAQETELAVIKNHIRTFVNEFSLNLGEVGQTAVAKLELMTREAGIMS